MAVALFQNDDTQLVAASRSAALRRHSTLCTGQAVLRHAAQQKRAEWQPLQILTERPSGLLVAPQRSQPVGAGQHHRTAAGQHIQQRRIVWMLLLREHQRRLAFRCDRIQARCSCD